MKFDIYGCCVSRDIFNYLDQEIYTPVQTIGGDIINSYVSHHSFKSLLDYLYLWDGTNFDKKMLEHMANGNSLEKLQGEDWILFDMANERLPLQKWILGESEGIVPVSWNTYKLQKKISEIDNNFRVEDWHFPDRDYKEWENYIIDTVNHIKNKYSSHNMIFISLRMTDNIRDDIHNKMLNYDRDRMSISEGIDEPLIRKKKNELIEEAEQIVLSHFPDIYVVPFPKYVFSIYTHHLGINPLHYDDLYYEYAARAIKLIAKNNININHEERVKLLNREISFLKHEYENKLLRVMSFSTLDNIK